MNILILGGAGFLGINLVRRCLSEPGVKVTVLDSLDPLYHSDLSHLDDALTRVQFVLGDIRDEKLMAEIVRQQDVIFDLAAQSSHTIAIENPVLDAEVNCLGTLKILEAVRKNNREAVVIYPSTSTVVGKSSEKIADEDQAAHPLEIYSANKAVAENYFLFYHRLYGLRTVVLRFANLYGPFGKGFPEFGFVNYFIYQAREGRPMKIFGSGDQLRNAMYVQDAAEILWRSALDEQLYGEVFFATSPFHYSVLQIAETISEILGPAEIEHVPWPEHRLRIDVGRACFSSEKLRAITGWTARYDLSEGLLATRDILESLEPSRLRE